MARSVGLLVLLSGVCVAAGCVGETEDDSERADAMLGTCAQATTSSALNLRATPSASGPLLLTIDAGTTVDVIESGAASGWAHVRVNGRDGYAKASFLACSAAPKPAFEAVLIGQSPIVDGAIDPMWQAAPPTAFDTDWSGKPTTSRTTVRAIWNATGLYLLWELEGAGLNTDQSRPVGVEREGLYNEDCVEIFFTPDPAEPKKYFEIELGPYGHYFDLSVDKKANTSDIHWQSGATIKTTVDPVNHRATIEVALTSPDIVRSLKVGASLPINMFRMEGKSPRQYLAWSPTRTPRPNFHVPEAFGTLRLR